VASLFTAATRRATLSTHAVTLALHCRLRTLERDRFRTSESTAAGRRNCFFKSVDSTYKYPAACCHSIPLHISLATILKDHWYCYAHQSWCKISEPGRLVGHSAAIRTGEAERQKGEQASQAESCCSYGWSRERCLLQEADSFVR
jgi:hypothetical protein